MSCENDSNNEKFTRSLTLETEQEGKGYSWCYSIERECGKRKVCIFKVNVYNFNHTLI